MGKIYQVVKRGSATSINLEGAGAFAAPIVAGDEWGTANKETGGGSAIPLAYIAESLTGNGIFSVRREWNGTWARGEMSFGETMFWLARIGGAAGELETMLDSRIRNANESLSNSSGYCSGY
jgi:hypothetical protein